ncbi:hypothetical protein [Methylocella silvestris]|uniref:hypothetical protein n=1 Tax=Methylocella silvestris TaxID=199596 RepID=UPI001FE09002|nr:hypothetical protein [Methylocella silvestris]
MSSTSRWSNAQLSAAFNVVSVRLAVSRRLRAASGSERSTARVFTFVANFPVRSFFGVATMLSRHLRTWSTVSAATSDLPSFGRMCRPARDLAS